MGAAKVATDRDSAHRVVLKLFHPTKNASKYRFLRRRWQKCSTHSTFQTRCQLYRPLTGDVVNISLLATLYEL